MRAAEVRKRTPAPGDGGLTSRIRVLVTFDGYVLTFALGNEDRLPKVRLQSQLPCRTDVIDDFIIGLALAIFGGTLAIMGLPTVRRWRLPSLPTQPVSQPRWWLRIEASIFAIDAGVPITLNGLAIVVATLAGYRIVFSL